MTDDRSRPYKILVVDDEPDLEPLIRQRMRRHVRSGKYEFKFAKDGIDALEKLEADHDIDLVLSDINMPRMDGLTLLEQIPTVDPDIRAVIISAYGDMDNIRTAMNRGAFDFVTKPVDFKDLTVTIDRALTNLAEWRDALQHRDQLVALRNELDIAHNLQQSILHTDFPVSESFEVFAQMRPARNVGGDFYDVIKLPNGRLVLVIADVSDKGVASALFMMAARTTLKAATIGAPGPERILTEANNLLSSDNPNFMFVTVFLAEYDPASGKLYYASGGHDRPVVVRNSGEVEIIEPTGGIALGVLPDFEFESASIVLNPGDVLVTYSDGVTDAVNAGGESFGLDGLIDLLAASPQSHAERTLQSVFEAVTNFAGGADQFDDITCLALSRSSNNASGT